MFNMPLSIPAYIVSFKWFFFLFFFCLDQHFFLWVCVDFSIPDLKKKNKHILTLVMSGLLYIYVEWQESDLYLVLLEMCCVGNLLVIPWITLLLCNAYEVFTECIAKHFLQPCFHLFFMSECVCFQ